MSGFSAQWLALREPADAASRNVELTARLIDWRRAQGRLSVLDLGSGTGANYRFLAPLLGGEQCWRLVDNDPTLLTPQTAFQHAPLERRCLDLATDRDRLAFRDVQLVSASALIDLVSAEWLEWLARRCREAQAALFMVLTYNGTVVWEPALPDDETVCAWLNRHQHTDKGFGPALGPQAAPTLQALLEGLNYQVDLRPSPWRLEPAQTALQSALLDGWVEAVGEIAPDAPDWLDEWAMQRRFWIEQGQSRLRVGHWDLFAARKSG